MYDVDKDRIYEYQDINPFHYRKIKYYLDKTWWGRFWQYVRRFEYVRYETKDKRNAVFT